MPKPDDDVQSWFDSLSPKIQRDLDEVVKAEAEDMSGAQRARLQSLLQPPEESGGLETSCRVEPGRNAGEVVVVAGGEGTTIRGYDHALGFEFGTAKQPARSFFWSTYRERARAARERIEQAITTALEKS